MFGVLRQVAAQCSEDGLDKRVQQEFVRSVYINEGYIPALGDVDLQSRFHHTFGTI